ncbi:MAG: cytochrome c [Candidimonas sp.]|nr:cytochrome c [Candidimonas sp.]
MKYSGISKLAGVMMLCFAGATAAGGPDAAQLEIGKALFKSGAVPACAICHTLKDAEAEGTIGPNLDEQKPDFAVVRKFVEEGSGAMPSFASTMSAEEMDAVSAYVAEVAGK